MVKEFPKLSGKLILAPMHKVTNIAFRILCKEYGASLSSTELLSANAVAKKNKAIMKLAFTDKIEKPVVAQIFSNNTEKMVEAAKILEKDFDIIDINFGCPSDRILKQGSGGFLLKRADKIKEIVEKISSSINKPLTVKIRTGLDKDSINAIAISKICEDSGASAIIIHARTVKQGYSGKADWDIIKQVKENVNIPIIGNGDVIDGESAKKILEYTGCDYIMIGRGAIGNPHIFKEINHYLNTGEIIKQTKKQRIDDYFKYISLCKKYDVFEVKDAKQKAIEFTKGYPGSTRLRQGLSKIKTFEEIEKQFEDFEKK
jgi:tRNA-dihydrouridine synthase B